jgi:FeS assembly ATPase SufC
MKDSLLKVENLRASVGDKELIKGLSLTINTGEIHVVMGPNGAGKSTLANVIMGHPNFEVTDGSIYFNGEDVTQKRTDERAKLGLFLSFQTPEEIPGVTMENFLKTAKSAVTGESVRSFAFRKEMYAKMDELHMNESYASRYVNVGFSGGERKKSEIFQMLMLNPKLAILDETDSGLDVDAVKIVAEGIRKYKNDDNSALIITHNTKILKNLKIDYVHILIDGKIVKTGDEALVNKVNSEGFGFIEEELKQRI